MNKLKYLQLRIPHDKKLKEWHHVTIDVVVIALLTIRFYFILRVLDFSWTILGMGSAEERRYYHVTAHLIGRAHTQNVPWIFVKNHKNVIAFFIILSTEREFFPAVLK